MRLPPLREVASFCPNGEGRGSRSSPPRSLRPHSSPSLHGRWGVARLRNRAHAGCALVAALVVWLVAAGNAAASSIVWVNDCAGDPNVAGCERLSYIAQMVRDGTGSVELARHSYGALYVIAGAVIGAPLAVLTVKTLFFAGRT
jgi:hypothetical protein